MNTHLTRLLSDLTVHMKYARMKPNGTKESWNELIERNRNMHVKKYGKKIEQDSKLRESFNKAYRLVEERKVLPSMRSLQFGGESIEKNNIRMYNCGYLPINSVSAFREVMYLLICGAGVGYSVEKHHIANIPKVKSKKKEYLHTIEDSIEGWADAFSVLINSYVGSMTRKPIFDYSLIRPKGSLIRTLNMEAPGSDGLSQALRKVEELLEAKNGHFLRSIDIMDIINCMSECVMSGGIRRSAMICLFSSDDMEMAHAKTGKWWETHPWRSRSNNSAVIYRNSSNEQHDFNVLWSIMRNSGAGEPGFYFSDDPTRSWGTNPCVETALRPNQFCNLTEINASNVISQHDLNERVQAAALLGTLQAGYTNFKYIRDEWKQNTERDALLGIGLTGIAFGSLDGLSLDKAVKTALRTNEYVSSKIGINPSSRVTCVKPSGTSSLVLGTSSGIHAIHSKYYIRHIRINKSDALYRHFSIYHPDLIEDEYGRENYSAVIKVPQNMEAQNASYRTESVIDFLCRLAKYNSEWVHPGHRNGYNKHNVSATITVKENEWNDVKKWLWDNRNLYTGVCCLPYDGGVYKQAPFQECTPEEYDKLAYSFSSLDLSNINNKGTTNSLIDIDSACAGGLCEI